jgi:hypothetical protein
MPQTSNSIFCTSCGTENVSQASFCMQCGAHIVRPAEVRGTPENDSENGAPTNVPPPPPPPPPPPVFAEPTTKTKYSVPLWNPVAAAAWSLIFGPILGAVLVGMNWESLGDQTRANRNFQWASSCALFLAILSWRPGTVDLVWVIQLAGPIVWAVVEARQQILLLGPQRAEYSKRGWLIPLVTAAVVSLIFNAWVAHVRDS